MYTLELMDHNVQMVYLDEIQAIVFQKDGYSIETVKSETIVSEAISEAISESKDVINIEDEVISEAIQDEVISESKGELKSEAIQDEVIKKVEETDDDYDDLPELIEENVKEKLE
jgi:hypothetical protein